jgi:hypothetical protein
MALLVVSVTLSFVPLKAAPALPYCTKDCTEDPQLPDMHGVGSGAAGVAAGATAANTVSKLPTATEAAAQLDAAHAHWQLSLRVVIAPIRAKVDRCSVILPSRNRQVRYGYMTDVMAADDLDLSDLICTQRRKRGPVLPQSPLGLFVTGW